MREQFRQRGCSLNVFIALCTQILYKKYKKSNIKLSLYPYCGHFTAHVLCIAHRKPTVLFCASEPDRKKGLI